MRSSRNGRPSTTAGDPETRDTPFNRLPATGAGYRTTALLLDQIIDQAEHVLGQQAS